MLSNNIIIYGPKIAIKLLWEIAFFPLWWYSAGLARLISTLREFLSNRQKELAFLVWVKNIFVPMYGEYDWEGRLISFGVRLVQIIARGIAMLAWIAISLAVLLVWLLLPAAVIWQIFYQLSIFIEF